MSARRRLAKPSGSQVTAPPQIKLDTEQQEKFDQELAWCLKKLNLMLLTEKDAKKFSENEKAAKTLRNSTIPLIKKRGIMSKIFGDYRAKMKHESNTANKELAKIVLADESQLKKMISKSKFVRKSNIKNQKAEESVQEDLLTEELEKLNIKTSNETESKKDFKFHFLIHEE